MTSRPPAARVDFGYPVLRPRTARLSARVPLRLMSVLLLLGATAILLGLSAVTIGDYPLSLSEVIAAFAGTGEDFHRMIVLEWRAPVAAAAVLFGPCSESAAPSSSH